MSALFGFEHRASDSGGRQQEPFLGLSISGLSISETPPPKKKKKKGKKKETNPTSEGDGRPIFRWLPTNRPRCLISGRWRCFEAPRETYRRKSSASGAEGKVGGMSHTGVPTALLRKTPKGRGGKEKWEASWAAVWLRLLVLYDKLPS